MSYDCLKLKELFPKIRTNFIPNFLINHQYKLKNKIDKENIIISSGRLDKIKQFDLLIKVFANIKHNNYKLIILGEGSERKNLQELINNYNLTNRVFLIGYVNNSDEYLKKSKIFVCTSKYESFGLVSVEAMEYGLPVVSFDFPAAKFISGENNSLVLVPQDNIKALTEQIDELIDNQDYYKNMSQKSLERFKYFSKERIIPMWLNIIEGENKDI
jgi:glycosyltransferase involved in cell wall biosynthesis